MTKVLHNIILTHTHTPCPHQHIVCVKSNIHKTQKLYLFHLLLTNINSSFSTHKGFKQKL